MRESNRGEFRTSNETGTAYISGYTFDRKKVTYCVVDGLAILEGDIVLGTIEQLQEQQAVATPGYRWYQGLIPYEKDPNLTNPARIDQAISLWRSKTNIRFKLRTASNGHFFPNYVRFQDGAGCTSTNVGGHFGRNDIFIDPNCTWGNVAHEIGHAVGLWHEQSREDRAQFVRIHEENMNEVDKIQFSQHITDGDDIGEYDYCSIMHYPANAFSNNGQDTIEVLQPTRPCGTQIGQRDHLSDGDIAAVNLLYPPLPDPVAVPEVIGMDRMGARLTILSAGLTPSIRGPPRKSEVDSQSPLPGTIVHRDSVVKAHLIKRTQEPLTAVPDTVS